MYLNTLKFVLIKILALRIRRRFREKVSFKTEQFMFRLRYINTVTLK